MEPFKCAKINNKRKLTTESKFQGSKIYWYVRVAKMISLLSAHYDNVKCSCNVI